jgi:thioredoxin-related protein
MIAVKINPEKSQANEALRDKYGIGGYPTILFLDAGGNKIHEIGGYAPPDPFAEEMRTALKKAKK